MTMTNYVKMKDWSIMADAIKEAMKKKFESLPADERDFLEEKAAMEAIESLDEKAAMEALRDAAMKSIEADKGAGTEHNNESQKNIRKISQQVLSEVIMENNFELENELQKSLRTIADLSEENNKLQEKNGVLEERRKHFKERQRTMQLRKKNHQRLPKTLEGGRYRKKKSSLILSCAVCKSTKTSDFSTAEQKLGAFATCNFCMNGGSFYVSVRDHHGDITKFKIHKKIKMKTVFETYATKRGLKVDLLSFFVDGKRIGPNNTAEFSGLKDKDTVHCQYNSAVLEFFRFIRKEVHEANPGVNLEEEEAIMMAKYEALPADKRSYWEEGLAGRNSKGVVQHTETPPKERPAAPPIGNKTESRVINHQPTASKSGKTPDKCENCGGEETQDKKLLVCSGCNMALYCSTTCQESAWKSHIRICQIVNNLPKRDEDSISLVYRNENALSRNIIDFDAGLRYAAKYMDSLTRIQIDTRGAYSKHAYSNGLIDIKITRTKLSLLLKLRKGKLNSVFWFSGDNLHEFEPEVTKRGHVWLELNGLTQLRLEYQQFDDIQTLHKLICQQKEEIRLLSLRGLSLERPSDSWKSLAIAVSFCKTLVKLELRESCLCDCDLEIMLHNLPNLRCLDLRDRCYDWRPLEPGFTDDACEIIARKCPNLQSLNLTEHFRITTKGIGTIFRGCPHLRELHSTVYMTLQQMKELLRAAPSLLCFGVDDEMCYGEDFLLDVVEDTGGRVLMYQMSTMEVCQMPGLSLESKLEYERLSELWGGICHKKRDPRTNNEWEEYFRRTRSGKRFSSLNFDSVNSVWITSS